MTTLLKVNPGLAFFASTSNKVSAMVPMTPNDVHRIVVAPLEKLAMQTEKAAHIRQDSSNKAGFDALQKCNEEVARALNGPSVAVTPTVENEQDESHSYKF